VEGLARGQSEAEHLLADALVEAQRVRLRAGVAHEELAEPRTVGHRLEEGHREVAGGLRGGHRVTCFLGSGLLAPGLGYAVEHGYPAIVAALNDTAQEVGTSVGTALVGTLLATLVVQVLPTGDWTPAPVASYFHGERVVFLVLAVVAGTIAAYGASTLTDSRETEEA
jgi:hypothetical protein